jgi:hypothetical protein
MTEIIITLVRSNEIQDIFHIEGTGRWYGINQYVYRPKGEYSLSDIAIEFLP